VKVIAAEEFLGHYRKQAKTTIWRTPSGQIARATQYHNLAQLLDSLPADATMRTKYPNLVISAAAPPAQKAAVSGRRVAEEQHNVQVDCWLYHVRLEGDDDYHTIVGSSAAPAGARFLNVEVSGLPARGQDRAALQKVRDQLTRLVGAPIGKTKYVDVVPPRKVRVTGSLFFDADHRRGQIGPPPHNPQTVWEIHPVTSIRAL
jgi:hypothetical protein